MSILETISGFNSQEDNLEDIETSLSFENIKHQFNTKLADEVVKELEPFMGKTRISSKEINRTRIPKLIKEYLGIEIRFEMFRDLNAYVPFTSMSIGTDHVIYDYFGIKVDDNGKKILRNKKSHKLSVDSNTGYIHGLDGIVHTIGLGTYLFDMDEFDEEHVAAVLFHELGHIWTYYMLLPHAMITNFIMGEYTERLLGIETKESKMVLVKEAEKEFGMDILEKERLVSTESQSEAALLLYTSHVSKLKSLSGLNPYDVRNCEALADQFVIRIGLGRANAEVDMFLSLIHI